MGSAEIPRPVLGLREILPVTPVAQIETSHSPRQREGLGPFLGEIDLEQKFRAIVAELMRRDGLENFQRAGGVTRAVVIISAELRGHGVIPRRLRLME